MGVGVGVHGDGGCKEGGAAGCYCTRIIEHLQEFALKRRAAACSCRFTLTLPIFQINSPALLGSVMSVMVRYPARNNSGQDHEIGATKAAAATGELWSQIPSEKFTLAWSGNSSAERTASSRRWDASMNKTGLIWTESS